MKSRGAASWNDVRIELAVSWILRGGLVLAAGLVLCGGAVYLARHGFETPHYRVFSGEPAELTDVAAIARYAVGGSGRGLIQLGLLALLATPIARVAFSVVAFALERDLLYVGLTLVVLAILGFSLLGGLPVH
ncbi:MAG: DUF1634 domain-containing protein [bacterium]